MEDVTTTKKCTTKPHSTTFPVCPGLSHPNNPNAHSIFHHNDARPIVVGNADGVGVRHVLHRCVLPVAFASAKPNNQRRRIINAFCVSVRSRVRVEARRCVTCICATAAAAAAEHNIADSSVWEACMSGNGACSQAYLGVEVRSEEWCRKMLSQYTILYTTLVSSSLIISACLASAVACIVCIMQQMRQRAEDEVGESRRKRGVLLHDEYVDLEVEQVDRMHTHIFKWTRAASSTDFPLHKWYNVPYLCRCNYSMSILGRWSAANLAHSIDVRKYIHTGKTCNKNNPLCN